MTRIDLEQIASEFGLLVEKRDVGTYKQWKNAQLDLYLPGNREAGYLVRGVYPPVENYVHYPCIDNLDLPSGVTRIKGKPEFSGRQQIYNDDFNEGWLRRVLGKLIEEYGLMTDPGYESPFIAAIPEIPAAMEPDHA